MAEEKKANKRPRPASEEGADADTDNTHEATIRALGQSAADLCKIVFVGKLFFADDDAYQRDMLGRLIRTPSHHNFVRVAWTYPHSSTQ